MPGPEGLPTRFGKSSLPWPLKRVQKWPTLVTSTDIRMSVFDLDYDAKNRTYAWNRLYYLFWLVGKVLRKLKRVVESVGQTTGFENIIPCSFLEVCATVFRTAKKAALIVRQTVCTIREPRQSISSPKAQ